MLSEETRQSIAAQVSDMAGLSPTIAFAEDEGELGESVEILIANVAEPDGPPPGGLADRVTRPGRWHHQVYRRNEATSYANSTSADGAEHEVVAVCRSNLPERIRRALELDPELTMAADTAWLVVSPSQQIHALWLQGEGVDAIIVTSAPEGSEELRPLMPMSSAEFAERLDRVPLIEGMPARRPPEAAL